MRPTVELNIRLVQASQPEPGRTCTICVGRSATKIQEALRIMRALADGANPGTGEALMADAVYQNAPVVRAFHRGGCIGISAGTRAFQEEATRQRRQVVVSGRRSAGLRRAKSYAGELIFTRLRRHTIEALVRSSRAW
jgi:hypothetical protein